MRKLFIITFLFNIALVVVSCIILPDKVAIHFVDKSAILYILNIFFICDPFIGKAKMQNSFS